MLIMLVVIGLLLLGFVGIWLYDNTVAFRYDTIVVISSIVAFLGICGLVVSIIWVILTNAQVPLKQATLDLEYETLLNEVAYVKDLQDEPVSDLARIEYTNIAERVLDWNKRALEAQTLGNSPWTNWFYNDAERSMKLIEFK